MRASTTSIPGRSLLAHSFVPHRSFCFCAVSVKVFQVHNSGVNCLSRQTVLSIRRKLQTSAEQIQPEAALPDAEVETDEMFQNAGEKGDKHVDASDPPRRRGNKRRGHGTYVISAYCFAKVSFVLYGTPILRRFQHTFISLRCRLQRCIRMVGAAIIFSAPVRLFSIRMAKETQTVMVFTRSIQIRLKVSGRRNFLRPFRGVHKKFLAGYVAICEFVTCQC